MTNIIVHATAVLEICTQIEVMDKELVKKYNVSGPRYTSYPTVAYWDADTSYDVERWKDNVLKTFNASNDQEGISIYIHLPFCERLCHYCGCHKRVTRLHNVEEPYIDRLLMEWQMYLDLFPTRPKIKELHLGGGTPTFFSATYLDKLLKGIMEGADPTENPEFSFEAHPSSTTIDKLKVLADHGFRRLSLGIQDFNMDVQRIINRVQTKKEIQLVTKMARKLEYNSINFDLIYGLPKQTSESIAYTIDETITMRPDRIAFYSYAHVPWVSKSQRLYSEEDLPRDDEKRALYELGKQKFLDAGYIEIGMDHFALPTDSLAEAMATETLHRNFMGYTTSETQLLIGLGASSISDAWTAFGQNEKNISAYERKIDNGEWPLFRGHFLDEEDQVLRQHITRLMCDFYTAWTPEESAIMNETQIRERLQEMEADGLCTLLPNGLVVTEEGRAFIRNICMAFDNRLYRDKPTKPIFSATV